jgi:Holliday junction resolvasome RuvABC endonuclease subunit
MDRLRILALDVATKTGWATSTASGVWDLKIKKDESKGMRLIRLKSKIVEICSLEKIELVVFERTSGFHKNALIVQAEMHGVMKATLEELGIDYRAYSAPEIKKHATGKGNAKKDAMIEAAQNRWPTMEVIDDNHADAYWLLDLAYTDLYE